MKNKILLILAIVIAISSCRKDDQDDNGLDPIQEADRTEQQAIDNDSLLGYFETHYYNSSELAALTNAKISDIVISLLEDGEDVPDGHTLLMDDVETKTTEFEEADYEYYILTINEGGGDKIPHFCDNVRVNYFGTLIDDDPDPFDSTINPDDFDLLQLVRGFQLAMTEFKIAESAMIQPDNTIEYNDYGLGVMFLPSGLGFFSSTSTSVPIYSPLVFKFELYDTEINDHDDDNVPTFIEDLNSNLDLRDDDTDENDFPNFFDSDDDGDGTLTIDEDLEDMDLMVDTDGDGDPTNDKDGDGDPTNDDTDGDGIPNYLDEDDSESRIDN